MATSYARLHFAGALSVDRYPEFRTVFENAPADRPALVDLRDVSSVDPTFLAELLLFQRRRRPQAVAVLVAPESDVARTFGLAAIKEKVPIAYDEQSARRMLQPEGD